MMEVVFKIWYMMAVLPFLIFLEANKFIIGYLKKKNIYNHWDVWHSFLFVAIALLIVLLITGYY